MSSPFTSLFLFMLLSVPVSRQACVVFGPRRAKAAWLTSSRLLRGRMSLHIGLPSRYTSAHTQQTNIQGGGGSAHAYSQNTDSTHTEQAKQIPHHTCTRSRWAVAIFSLAARTQSHIQQEIHRMAVYEDAAYFGVLWLTTAVGQRLIHAVTSDRSRMEGQSGVKVIPSLNAVSNVSSVGVNLCPSFFSLFFFLFFEWPQSIKCVHIKMQI